MKSVLAYCFFFLLILSVHAQELNLIPPVGHTREVYFAEFSKDGKYVVTASKDNTAKIWEVGTGLLVADLTGHSDKIRCVQFSSDGKHIVTGSSDGTARVWSAATGALLLELPKTEDGGIYTAVFSPDNKKILTCYSYRNVARIWDAKTGTLIAALIAPAGRGDHLRTAFFSPDGKSIISASTSGDATLWNTETGKTVATLPHDDEINAAIFSPDNKKIITASKDHLAKIWDGTTGTLLKTLKGHTGAIYAALFSTDAKKIATASEDSTAKIWDVETGKLIKTLKGHTAPIAIAQFSPDNQKILTTSADSTSKTWDARTGTLLRTFSGIVSYDLQASIFSYDSKKIVTIAIENFAKIWDVETGKLIQNLQGHSFNASTVVYSPDNLQFASVGEDNIVKIWDANTGHFLFALNDKAYKNSSFDFMVCYSPDNKTILFRAENYIVRVYDALTGMKKFDLKGHTGNIYYAAFSPDNKKIITTSEDKTAKIWDTNTGKLLKTLEGHIGIVIFAAFSPDNKRIATTSNDGKLKLWDANAGTLLLDLEGNYSGSGDVAFSPDNKNILSLSFHNDDTMYVRDVDSGIIRAQLTHTNRGEILSAVFSKDNKKILTAAQDDAARVWDFTGNLLLELKHNDDIFYATFSPDEKEIITASADHSIKIWNSSTGKLIRTIDLGPTTYFSDISFIHERIITINNSEIIFFDLKTGQRLYSLLPIDRSDYLIRLPSDFYTCTQNTAKLLHYVKGLQVISFEQLDIKYNRPDKVLETIDNKDTTLIRAYNKAYYKRIKKLGLDTNSFRSDYTIPEANFVNRESVNMQNTKGSVSLQIKAADSSYSLDKFNVWVNEVPIFGLKGINIQRHNHFFDTTLTITLSQGNNRIEASVINANGIESYRTPLFVKYTPVQSTKQKTHFIGIGINQFLNPSYNLQWSVKDIRDLAIKLKKKYGNDILIDTLFDNKVTRDNVLALKQKLLSLSEDDEVIISYSGHGVLNKEYDYFLSTYAINFDEPEKQGLPYDDLESLLDGIKPRKKLLLIDACHSGELDKDEIAHIETVTKQLDSSGITHKSSIKIIPNKNIGMANSFELMQSLFVNVGKGTGATIISAAGGMQYAQERGDLKNGVFTYSILEAFNQHNELNVSELKRIVGERVTQLTHGLQKPTFRNETNNFDWRVW